MVMLGSCRGPEDEARVAALRRLVAEEGIEVRVCLGVGLVDRSGYDSDH